MFYTLVSGLGHCIQPIYRTLVAIEEYSLSWIGPQVTCKCVGPQQQLFS